MSKFSIDYDGLEKKINKKAYKLNEVKDSIEVVAFDIVRFKDADKSSDLWQIQSADDGDYIVALYQNEDKVESSWNVTLSKIANSLHISYKGDPIITISAKHLGIPESELKKVPEYLPEKLATNKKLMKSLLNKLPESTKKQVLNKYPELV